MTLTLRQRSTSTIPICAAGVLPEVVCYLSQLEISKLPVRLGKRRIELGELFDISMTCQTDQLEWTGNLKSVNWIGKLMSHGKVVVDGDVGRHIGSQMSGGTIHVSGSASDFAGCEMSGGSINIAGDASDWVGAAYPGTKAGMKGGTIFVHGSVGHGAGFAMRRGTICIGGDAQRLVGWNMLAGSIIVGHSIGAMAGKGMLRGSLIFPNENLASHNLAQLPMSFTSGAKLRPVAIDALRQSLNNGDAPVSLNASVYQMLHGDHLRGGRGEVFIASEMSY